MKVTYKNSKLVFTELEYIPYGVDKDDMNTFTSTLPETNYYAMYDGNCDIGTNKICGVIVKCNSAGALDIYSIDFYLSAKIEGVHQTFNVVEGINELIFDEPLAINRIPAVKTNLVAWKGSYKDLKYLEATASATNLNSASTGVVPAMSWLTLPRT